jgi:hypothetical protein
MADAPSRDAVWARQIARTLDWTFTRADLERVLMALSRLKGAARGR